VRAFALAALTTLTLAACKPPPTDAGMDRERPQAALDFASEPLPSPETDGAGWAPSSRVEGRIIYGVPGEPALLALECLDNEARAPRIQITRLSPADEGASALLALVGNGHIGRLAVEAREVDGRSVWRGELLAADLAWEPLSGPRSLGVTVPGAGRVELNPNPLPGELVERCRKGEPPAPPELLPPVPEPDLADIEDDLGSVP